MKGSYLPGLVGGVEKTPQRCQLTLKGKPALRRKNRNQNLKIEEIRKAREVKGVEWEVSRSKDGSGPTKKHHFFNQKKIFLSLILKIKNSN